MEEKNGETVVAEYSLDMSRKDLREAMADVTVNIPSNKRNTRRGQIVFWVLALILIIIAAIPLMSGGKIDTFYLIFSLIFICFSFALIPIRKMQALKAINSSYPSHTVNYFISGKEIHTVSPVAELHLQWDMFHTVWENENFIILLGVSMHAAVCDKKAISPDELDKVRMLIKNNVKNDAAA